MALNFNGGFIEKSPPSSRTFWLSEFARAGPRLPGLLFQPVGGIEFQPSRVFRPRSQALVAFDTGDPVKSFRSPGREANSRDNHLPAGCRRDPPTGNRAEGRNDRFHSPAGAACGESRPSGGWKKTPASDCLKSLGAGPVSEAGNCQSANRSLPLWQRHSGRRNLPALALDGDLRTHPHSSGRT